MYQYQFVDKAFIPLKSNKESNLDRFIKVIVVSIEKKGLDSQRFDIL